MRASGDRTNRPMTTLTRTTSTFKTAASPVDAIALQRSDHERLRSLFADYQATHLESDKRALVADICLAMRVHMRIDEDVFYPAIDAVVCSLRPASSSALARLAVSGLIDQLEASCTDLPSLDRLVGELADPLRQHVRDEHLDLFPWLRKAELDLVQLGQRMATRRVELLGRKA